MGIVNEIEQQTSDIDWFFTNNYNVVFVASGGGKLPQSVVQSIADSEILLAFFKSLPIISEVIINPNLDKIISNVDEYYLADFTYFSKRGLFSFDKTHLNDFLDPSYHLVAKPILPLQFKQLPAEVRDILGETFYKGSIESSINCELIS
jgi:hypothetical protein